MILVEGPDGAGKTVLVGQLLTQFKSLRMAANVGDRKGDDRKKIEEKLISTTRRRTYDALAEEWRGTRPLIHDRLYFSELVYGKVLRSGVKFSIEEQGLIEDVLGILEVPVIICLPPFEVVRNNVQNSEDHLEGVTEHIETLYGEYLRLASELQGGNLNFIGYDYTRPGDQHDVTNVIETYLKVRSSREP